MLCELKSVCFIFAHVCLSQTFSNLIVHKGVCKRIRALHVLNR